MTDKEVIRWVSSLSHPKHLELALTDMDTSFEGFDLTREERRAIEESFYFREALSDPMRRALSRSGSLEACSTDELLRLARHVANVDSGRGEPAAEVLSRLRVDLRDELGKRRTGQVDESEIGELIERLG